MCAPLGARTEVVGGLSVHPTGFSGYATAPALVLGPNNNTPNNTTGYTKTMLVDKSLI